MVDSIKYSVIIPTYNSSRTILRALTSVKQQVYAPYEVIIIDDASHDFVSLNTIIKMVDLGSISLKILRNTENLNGAASRNRGVNEAHGDFIAFLDADDEWASDKLLRISQEITLRGSRLIYFSQVMVVMDGSEFNIRPKNSPIEDQNISEYLFLTGGFIQTSTIVVSRAIALEIRFNELYARHQDYDFCLRAGNVYDFYFLEAPLASYHVSGKVYKAKKDDYEYCKWWSREMREYMSKDGYHGYCLFAITGRLFVQKRYFLAFKNVLMAISGLGIRGTYLAFGRIGDVLKNLSGK